MEKKKIIAIDIDEVIRSKRLQFDRYYAQEFGEDGIKYPLNTFNIRNHYDFKDTVNVVNYLNDELPEDISPTEYMLDANGTAAVDHMAFRKDEEKLTADQAFNKFMYEDFLIEIFGSSPVLYRGLDIHLREFSTTFDEFATIVLFSTEQNPSISPTLFFLSKIRTTIREIHFLNNNIDIWKKGVDVVITTDPEILESSIGKTVKIEREWNENNTGDYKALNVIDLIKNNEFRTFLGAPDYVEPVEQLNQTQENK